ncbi:hypothetical protein C8Q76DRAFT_757730 [Earliella scabrosa]|nr:hypothetical protein C8Q76DRAFT_757730 [Earliella scabrosa]
MAFIPFSIFLICVNFSCSSVSDQLFRRCIGTYYTWMGTVSIDSCETARVIDNGAVDISCVLCGYMLLVWTSTIR